MVYRDPADSDYRPKVVQARARTSNRIRDRPFGAEAGELIAVVQTAMLSGAPYTLLRDALLTHPTIAEGLGVLFQVAPQPPPAT